MRLESAVSSSCPSFGLHRLSASLLDLWRSIWAFSSVSRDAKTAKSRNMVGTMLMHVPMYLVMTEAHSVLIHSGSLETQPTQ